MTLGTGHYSSGGGGGGGGLEENIGGGSTFCCLSSWGGGLCFSYHCLSVAFKNLKRKIMLLNKKLTAEKCGRSHQIAPIFQKVFQRSMSPA